MESRFVEYETSYIIESINLAQKFNIDCEIAVDSRAVQRLGALTTLPLTVENPCIIFDPSELNLKLLKIYTIYNTLYNIYYIHDIPFS